MSTPQRDQYFLSTALIGGGASLSADNIIGYLFLQLSLKRGGALIFFKKWGEFFTKNFL